jgi:NADH-quinone oxidoreductase subunit I
MGALREIWDDVAGLWSLVVGLKTTGTCFVNDQVTVHYPRNEVDNLESFRGPIELVESPDDPYKPLCIACMTCVSVCPHECITVVKKKPGNKEEGPEKKESGAGNGDVKKKAPKGPARFTYDYTLCCLCGFCMENCPVHSIRFSNRGYLAGEDKDAFTFDLLEPFNPGST